MTVVVPLLAALSLIGLTGCNTTEGFGKDVQATGDYIEEKASDDETAD